ncbi:uncharacterized protein LOC108672357 [Hyalella azteca]|uniref:Uncharacterized protein LOC108672357 n=1 Tax=Hyalella azteca TaxID=294128 RepID=A0A8B7NQY6_HYAAZ|nr:uncharacterized protein LOC108672357 [Hyalella azteca]
MTRRAEDQTNGDIDDLSTMNADRNESNGGSKSCSAPAPPLIEEAGSKPALVPTSPSRISGQRTKRKRTQSCTFCQNHGFTMPKPGHQCPNTKCQCLLCRLTRIARIVMKHQQALWRHQAKELNKAKLGHLAKLRQVCDKCRNHNQFPKKRGHSICPFEQCTCPYCTLTDKRRYVMMHLQRIRRAQVTAMAVFESDEDDMETEDTDHGRGSSKENFDFPAEGREVAAVIEGVTKALRALPSPVRKLSSQTAADHETLDLSQEASGESEEALDESQEELKEDLDESQDEIEETLKALDATPEVTSMDAT